jgi:uncharacterized membrane protein
MDGRTDRTGVVDVVRGAFAAGDNAAAAAGRRVQVASLAFPAAIVWLGLVHVVFGEELRRMLPVWPDYLPGRPLWAHGAGVALVLLGGLMLTRRHSRTAALLLGTTLLLPVLLLHVPRAVPTGTFGDAWLNVLKWLAIASAPFAVARHLNSVDAEPAGTASAMDRVVGTAAAAAPWLLAAFMIGSAVLHVRYAEFVALLMQPWLPWRLFWTYFAAAALAAGGVGLMLGRTRPLAALLTSTMIFSWFFLVHTPRMLVDPTGPVGWSEMAEALAFSAFALALSSPSRRGIRAR